MQPSSLLLERDVELDALRRALTRAQEGEGGLVAVEGPAGIGKTRLLRAGQALAEEHNLLVLVARGGAALPRVPGAAAGGAGRPDAGHGALRRAGGRPAAPARAARRPGRRDG